MKKSKKLLILGFVLIVSIFFTACSRSVINFSISFESNGGTYCASVESTNIESIKMPNDPTQEGYTFLGWYWDDGVWEEAFTINSLLDKPLSERMELRVYARWMGDGEELPDDVIAPVGDIPSFTRSFVIQFDSKGGTTEDSISSENLSTAAIPHPTKEHYIFQGWFWDDGKVFTYNSINDRPLIEFPNLTVFAKWKGVDCTVNFNANGGTVTSLTQTVVYMSQDLSFPVPTKSESVFEGWYFDNEYTEKATDGGNASIVVYNKQWQNLTPTTLYAKWGPAPYAVFLNAVGSDIYGAPKIMGHSEHTVTVYKNQPMNLPEAECAGYNFEGWYTETNGRGTKVNPSALYTGSVLAPLYAHFSPKTYTITFNGAGGTVYQMKNGIKNPVTSLNVTFGEYYDSYSYTLPQADKDGWGFDYWMIDGVQVNEIGRYTYAHDVTMTAAYFVFSSTHDVTFDAQGGFIGGKINGHDLSNWQWTTYSWSFGNVEYVFNYSFWINAYKQGY